MSNKNTKLGQSAYALPRSWLDRYHQTYPELSLEIFEAIFALRRTAQRVDNAFAAWLSTTELSPAKMAILMIVWGAGDEQVSFTQIGTHLSVTRATVSGLIDGLVRDDYLLRAEDPQDRRNSLVRLSESGRARLTHVMDDHCRRLTEAFGEIEPRELAKLARLLTKFAGRAEAIS